MDYLANKLYEIPRDEWPDIGGLILSEQWPDRLAPKPADWDEMHWESREKMLSGALKEIEKDCGIKMLRRHQKKAQHGWSDAEFDDWWEFQNRNGSDLWWILQSTLWDQTAEKPSENSGNERRKKLDAAIFPALGAFVGLFLSTLLANLLHLI